MSVQLSVHVRISRPILSHVKDASTLAKFARSLIRHAPKYSMYRRPIASMAIDLATSMAASRYGIIFRVDESELGRIRDGVAHIGHSRSYDACFNQRQLFFFFGRAKETCLFPPYHLENRTGQSIVSK